MGVANLAKLVDGTYQVVPYERNISALAALAATVAPVITGTFTGGSTMTAVAATWNVAVTVTARRWAQSSTTDTVKTGTGATFVNDSVGVATTLVLTEDVIDAVGRTANASSISYAISANTSAPAITTAPTLAPTGGQVGTPITMTYGAVTGSPTPTNTRELLFGTTLVTTAASYTPLTADIGKSLTGKQTATNGVGVPAVRLSAPVVITSASAITTVSTLTDAINSARTAANGAIIEVTGGVKSPESITNTTATTKTGRVTIRAQDPDNPPIFQVNSNYNTILLLNRWNGFIFDGLQFNNPNTKDWRNGPNIREDISSGTPNPNIAGARWTPFGMRLEDCQNIKITNCIFRELNGAIDVTSAGPNDWTLASSNFEISYNTVVASRLDSFRFYQRCVNWDVHHNKITHSAYMPWQNDLNRHQDANQLALTGSRPLGCNGVRFYDNWTQSLQVGTNMHGYFLHNERVAENSMPLATYGHRNISVRRCMVIGANPYAVGFSGVDGGVSEQNIIRWSPGQQAFATANSNPGNHTPCYYLNSPRNNNITFNNCVGVAYPGTSTLSYGPGNAGSTNITKTNMVASNTAVPTGWATTDVALGIYGAYGDSTAV